MEIFVEKFRTGDGLDETGFDPCYLGYFECFNTQCYYEAHDVLEHLWLRNGRSSPDHLFYKGLIQLAGGFVHLKLHYSHPQHPKHGRRLDPARRLFLLAAGNLSAYPLRHQGIDLEIPLAMCAKFAALLKGTRQFGLIGGDDHSENVAPNPWDPSDPPQLPVPDHSI